VLAAVDFSLFSRRAVQVAAALLPGTAFELLHAYHVPFEGFLKDTVTREQVVAEVRARFATLLDEEMTQFVARLANPRPSFECVMVHGPVRDVIYARAQETRAELLVIGTHGKTGLAHALLGSVAEDLLRAPPCDVLAVGAW
jgi:nucleotide-binding universal stress UspA family protein